MREFGGASDGGLRRQFLLTTACLVVGLYFYLIPAGLQQSVVSGIRLTLLGPFLDVRSTVSAVRTKSREADVLRARVDSLNAWIANNALAIEENRRLRNLAGLAPRVERSYRPANVHRPGDLGAPSMFVLDLGKEDGVHELSPIITVDGLAGRVLEAHTTLSIGMDWSHPDFRASVMSEDGEFYGIVEPEPAAAGGAERLMLTGIAFLDLIEDGTLVVTSGRGGVYPRGLPVGRVRGAAEVDEGWHRSYWIHPSVHPASVTHVLVGVSVRTGLKEPGDLSAVFQEGRSPVPGVPGASEPTRPPTTDGSG